MSILKNMTCTYSKVRRGTNGLIIRHVGSEKTEGRQSQACRGTGKQAYKSTQTGSQARRHRDRETGRKTGEGRKQTKRRHTGMQAEKRRIDKRMSGATQVDRKTDKYAVCQANMQSAKQAETGKTGITGKQGSMQTGRQTD